ncbi:hypothetical protein BJV78DRAFT_1279511 [Lactifluus subvellereus]|nr:hypothetical protein BJV78DRAFT_1279511 [Lactifluus subvellereus]
MAHGELIFMRSILTPSNHFAREYTCTLPSLRLPAPRLALNFVRRYKRAFPPEYAKLRLQVAALDLSAFVSASVDVLKDEQEPLQLHFEWPVTGWRYLNDLPAGAAGPYHENRLQVSVADSQCGRIGIPPSRSLDHSRATAGELALAAPATAVGPGVNDFDAARLDWGRLPYRLFPGVSDI